MLRKWDNLLAIMKCDEVKEYYDILSHKKGQLALKRCFDVVLALDLLAILALPMLIIAVLIKLDSKGPVFYRQERVTAYGRKFRIHKFRTMVQNAVLNRLRSYIEMAGIRKRFLLTSRASIRLKT